MKTLLSENSLVFNPPQLGCVLFLSGLPGSGNKIYDRSPYCNIGTITGATWVRLPSGLWCLSFDGTDDNVDCGNNPSLALLQWTYKLWLNRHVDSGTEEYLMSKSSAGDWDWTLYIGAATDKINFGFKDTGAAARYMGNIPHDIALSQWYYLVITFDGTYIRGYLEPGNHTVVSADFSAFTPRTSTRKVYLGLWRTTYNFDGDIALPEIHKRPWNALDVQNSFNREKHLFGVW